jgi:hypothetical protein
MKLCGKWRREAFKWTKTKREKKQGSKGRQRTMHTKTNRQTDRQTDRQTEQKPEKMKTVLTQRCKITRGKDYNSLHKDDKIREFALVCSWRAGCFVK